MPPAPVARDKVLDAFATILVTQGERAATIEAVAAQAGVSKGGLLYHFASKQALVDGLLERLVELAAADVLDMHAAPEGPVDHFLRTSAQSDTDFDRVYVAVTRLPQDTYPQARAALDTAHEGWHREVLDAVGDPVVARAVVLMGDGLYLEASRTGDWDADSRSRRRKDARVDELLVLVEEMRAARAAERGP
ncbi:TetR family transcriptional regulator [Sediminihabitans luteus]|uniref:TetR family transcriptional regulator n=1 Tax=Sediminihabitans luteus TaxID=1138585 RepID=A0A2M9CPX0_9CELL|nr:TetR/AcrR family transcriptional regulator [Sediminihabitans luteus]PJJ73905.1 TetR family transcriptional regulator [Sediminihabitans luteus]GII98183.1 TetR family transcriptional regulator [Sediminihabitans luteus]